MSSFVFETMPKFVAFSGKEDSLLKAYIEENPGKEVYKGLGFWVFADDEDPPTHEVLDKYASDQVPIIIAGGGGHAALMNQKAIEYSMSRI